MACPFICERDESGGKAKKNCARRPLWAVDRHGAPSGRKGPPQMAVPLRLRPDHGGLSVQSDVRTDEELRLPWRKASPSARGSDGQTLWKGGCAGADGQTAERLGDVALRLRLRDPFRDLRTKSGAGVHDALRLQPKEKKKSVEEGFNGASVWRVDRFGADQPAHQNRIHLLAVPLQLRKGM